MSIQDVIHPHEWESQPDPLFYLTARYRRALEKAIVPRPSSTCGCTASGKAAPGTRC